VSKRGKGAPRRQLGTGVALQPAGGSRIVRPAHRVLEVLVYPTPSHISADAALLVQHARDALLRAEVELFCDHEHEAIKAIRLAREAVVASAVVPMRARLEIEEATWHIRHHEVAKALYSLEAARGHLSDVAASGPVSR
jgi:hypothetical protein